MIRMLLALRRNHWIAAMILSLLWGCGGGGGGGGEVTDRASVPTSTVGGNDVIIAPPDGSGTVASPPSSGTTPTQPGSTALAAPSGLTIASRGSSLLDLKWNYSDSVIDGFKIEINTGSTFTEVATVGATATSHTLSQLTPSKQYYCRVRAFKGDSTSDYSNTVAQKTGDLAWSSLLNTASAPPAARSGHRAVHDEANHRMILCGGLSNDIPLSDVWSLNLQNMSWQSLPSMSAGRFYHSAIVDPVAKRMIVFGGGVGPNKTVNGEVWALSLSGEPGWLQLSFPTSMVLPSARAGHTAVYDKANKRMIVFGGFTANGAQNDVWELKLSVNPPAWNQFQFPSEDPQPQPRYYHTAIYDDAHQCMTVFGGSSQSQSGNNVPKNDVWSLTLSGTPKWTQLSSFPSARMGHSAIYDSANQRMIVVGGFPDGACDTWALDLAGTPVWSQLLPSSPLVSYVFGHSAIYDGEAQRMVVFGGVTGGASTNTLTALAD